MFLIEIVYFQLKFSINPNFVHFQSANGVFLLGKWLKIKLSPIFGLKLAFFTFNLSKKRFLKYLHQNDIILPNLP